jgi:hypothetical protein
MTVTIDLPADALARLTAEANRRGVSIEAVIADLADQLPADQPGPARRSLAFVGAGASGGGITARMEELLADGFGRD